jgi:hypothetical protein
MSIRRFGCGIAAAVCLFLIAGCSSTVPVPRRIIDPPLSRTIPAPQGWMDVTDKALSPDVEYWLLADHRSASLLLRELQPSRAVGAFSSDESILTIAHLSLRLKLAGLGTGLRITQSPVLFESDRSFAVYAYSEKGLLRRVLCFRKRTRFYELELAQENEEEEFGTHLAAQITFAESVMRD